MELEQRILQNMQASIETMQANMNDIAGPLGAASQLIVSAFLNGGKIISCGNGAMAATAQQLAAYLSSQYKNERPSLPAITLGPDTVTLTAVASNHGLADIFNHSVQSLGQENDVLVIFSYEGLETNLIQAVLAAHDRDMQVIAITGHQGGDLADLLRVGDIEVRIDSLDNARIQEMQLLIVHCMCDLIDHQLFGVE